MVRCQRCDWRLDVSRSFFLQRHTLAFLSHTGFKEQAHGSNKKAISVQESLQFINQRKDI